MRIHQMNEICELFKADQKKEMWIPVPPEMPKPRTQCNSVAACLLFRASAGAAYQKNNRGDNCLRANQFPGLGGICPRQISRKNQNHHTGKSQVAERHPFKCAEPFPDARQFRAKKSPANGSSAREPKQVCRISSRSQRRFRRTCFSSAHRAAYIAIFPRVHFSTFLFTASISRILSNCVVPARLPRHKSVQASICQPCDCAMRRICAVGFTA